MTKFYFRVRAVNQSIHAYCVDAADQSTADPSITRYTGVREWERIEAKEIPADMMFEPSQEAPEMHEGE
jgi:hypothetical protein